MDEGTAFDGGRGVGADILGLVTSGMYTDPLAVYREYLQNAVDAIQSAGVAEGLIEIRFEVEGRNVSIRDNGPGLSLAEARNSLVPIAKSAKRGRGLRGFRGIGRLAGLAFAEAVTFLTRAGRQCPIVQVTWDSAAVNSGVARGEDLADVVDRAVAVGTVDGDGYPSRFFEVRIDGVARHAAGAMMNRTRVRQYIGEVCPVPFLDCFRHAAEILNLFECGEKPFAVRVCLDDEDVAVTRPHGCSVKVSEHESQDIVEIEAVRVAGLRGRALAAIGWIGHTQYRGAILKNCGVRGIRARVGNVQIGGERVFAHLFSEDRFNLWCVGEIHVLDPAVVPNARRDYFEPGVHLRNLENHLGAVCRGLERRCRSASRERMKERRLRSFLAEAEEMLDLASSGYLSTEEARKRVQDVAREATEWKEKFAVASGGDETVEALGKVTDRLKSVQEHSVAAELPGVGAVEAPVYREVFGALSELLPRASDAKRVIEGILDRIEERRRSRYGLTGTDGG